MDKKSEFLAFEFAKVSFKLLIQAFCCLTPNRFGVIIEILEKFQALKTKISSKS